jgi:hypothetical protein
MHWTSTCLYVSVYAMVQLGGYEIKLDNKIYVMHLYRIELKVNELFNTFLFLFDNQSIDF